MPAKAICFASAKGGSGKTIITASIASFLTGLGKKCLVIDCDAATHGMTLLYISEVSANTDYKKKGLFNISSESEVYNILTYSLVSVENGFDMLPATYEFVKGFDPEKHFNESILKKIVDTSSSSYDYILLDAQAGSDKYSRLAASKAISNQVVIVSEYDPLSVAGIERLKQVMGDDLDYTRTSILYNKMLPEFIDKYSDFMSIAKYLPPIPWNASVVKFYANRRISLDLEKGNIFTLAIMNVIKALLGDSIEEQIMSWAEKRSYELREPIVQQYSDTEKQLKYILQDQADILFKAKKREYLLKTTIITSIVTFFYLIFNRIGLSYDSIYREIIMDILNKPYSIIAILLIFGTIVYISFDAYKFLENIFGLNKSDIYVRNQRKIEYLQEKLKELEALKNAELSTIIKEYK
jgi:cellulose biosynthesis protein BcsQ